MIRRHENIREKAKKVYSIPEFKDKNVTVHSNFKCDCILFEVDNVRHEYKLSSFPSLRGYNNLQIRPILLSENYFEAITKLEQKLKELYKTKSAIKKQFGVESKEFKDICSLIYPYKQDVRLLRSYI